MGERRRPGHAARMIDVPGVRVMSFLIAATAATLGTEVGAQQLVGRVVDERTGLAVRGAVVRLLGRDGRTDAYAVTDSVGRFTLVPSAEGEFMLQARGFGYHPASSPLLSLKSEGVVQLDIGLVPAPVGIEGVTVSVEREAEALLRTLGHSPRSLGLRWIDRPTIEATPVPLGTRDIIRWRGIPGVWVQETGTAPGVSGLCVSFRRGRAFGGERCALILLNGVPIRPDAADGLSADEIEAIAILTPVDGNALYGAVGGGGVVLIWTRSGGP